MYRNEHEPRIRTGVKLATLSLSRALMMCVRKAVARFRLVQRRLVRGNQDEPHGILAVLASAKPCLGTPRICCNQPRKATCQAKAECKH